MSNLKYFLSLAAMLAAFIFVGELVMAEQPHEVIVDEIEIIEAEEIGIKTIDEEFETLDVYEEVISEDKDMDESSVFEEEVLPVEPANKESEDVEEVEYDSPEAEPLMYEGNKEGVYFEANCFDCECHEYCYKCEECTLEEDIFWDEEINPENGWVFSKDCIVCGHGGCEPVDEEFVIQYSE